MGGNLHKAQLTLLFLLVAAFFHPSHAARKSIFNVDIFPVINVTFVNEANHSVDLVCSADEIRDKIIMLGPGEEISWAVRDVLFPLVWCYVEINNDEWGIFWGYQAKLRCYSHCNWMIRDDGIWLKRRRYEDKVWLNHNGGGF